MNEDVEGAQLIQNNTQPQVSDLYFSGNNVLTNDTRDFSLDGTLVFSGDEIKRR